MSGVLHFILTVTVFCFWACTFFCVWFCGGDGWWVVFVFQYEYMNWCMHVYSRISSLILLYFINYVFTQCMCVYIYVFVCIYINVYVTFIKFISRNFFRLCSVCTFLLGISLLLYVWKCRNTWASFFLFMHVF